MGDFIEVRWSTDSLDEARKVCRYLVQEGLVACAHITPWTESIYRWNNRVETVQEATVALKTRLTLFDKVKDVIVSNSNYELPEIVFFRIDGGSIEYLNWLEESAPDLPTSEVLS